MAYFLSPVLNEQQFDANGVPRAGALITTYLAGTLTAVTTYKTSSGTAQTNPIQLDSSGNFPNGTQLWLLGGLTYKLVITDSDGSNSRTYDNISGIGDSATIADQFPFVAPAATYVSPTSFSFAGDQTNEAQRGRRIRSINTGGTIYSTIVNAVFGAGITTVTVINDVGALDSGLSQVNYSLLTPLFPAIPAIYAKTANLGLVGVNNSVTPATKYDLSATTVVFRDAARNARSVSDITTKTCDFSLAGPAANGRDQVAVFPASQWVQIFWIYNATTDTVALTASLNASTAAPTLPAGYTFYAYATSVRWDGSSSILRTYVRGAFASYATQQVGLTSGVAIVETTVNLAAFIPPGATRYQINAVYTNGAGAQSGFLKLSAGVTFTATDLPASITLPRDITFPNVGQALIYVQSAATLALGIGVMGYYVANGDS